MEDRGTMSRSHQGAFSLSGARLLRRHRRVLAGVAAAASIASLGMALQPPAPLTRGVVVAAADLPAGRVLAGEDLRIAAVPQAVMPVGTSADPTEFIGRTLSAPMARGEALADHRFTDLPSWSVPVGRMPLPVRFADAGAAALLSAGQRVDVVASSGPGSQEATPFASAELVAQDVLVLAVITQDPGAGGLLGGSGPSADQSPLVMLAADRGTALAIAGAQGRASLGFLMHPSRG
jgi:Flp pilus assembly protein CpaB